MDSELRNKISHLSIDPPIATEDPKKHARAMPYLLS